MKDLFDGLFVLEVANNHGGILERGKKIIEEHGKIAKNNEISKVAFKLQFRDVDSFVHKNFYHNKDIRYVEKVVRSKMTVAQYKELVDYIRDSGFITISTPFDEKSVDFCMELDLDIIKIASSEIMDWILVEKIASTGKPVIISTGGTYFEDIDNIVNFFLKKDIPIAINHCVSIYPTPSECLELNQIDFLINQYPNLVVGYSTHEYNECLEETMMMAYAKGARTFERHINIDYSLGPKVDLYHSYPKDIDRWFKAWNRAKLLCGLESKNKKDPFVEELDYLETFNRGVYLKRDVKKGEILTRDNTYLSIPLLKGQLSAKELNFKETFRKKLFQDGEILIEDIEADYISKKLVQNIKNRGI